MKSRLQRESKTVKKMIELYCRHNHNDNLCRDCGDLIQYVDLKLAKCPFRENKPACDKCEVHCYRSVEREKIRQIMRYSGPKMIYHHPYLAVMHVIDKTRKTDISELSVLLKDKKP